MSTRVPTQIEQEWRGEPARALIALHARRSADSIARFREAFQQGPIALVLTGTDIYRDIDSDAAARHSLRCADHLVVLQKQALQRLSEGDRAKARVIVQSASGLLCGDKSEQSFDFIAIGHLREEKDPLTLMGAARLLTGLAGIRILHVGTALSDELGRAALETQDSCAHYRWLGGLPQPAARRRLARSRVLVHMSRLEGGANVIAEALRSRVPVLASRIDGNVGLLGAGYDGYFEAGDASALAALIRQVVEQPSFYCHLQAQCLLLEPLFRPAREATAVRKLVADMLAGPSR